MARQSEAALREKEVELECLSTSKQHEGGSLRTTLQAKEIELTKTMDKLLQVSFIIDTCELSVAKHIMSNNEFC